MTLLATSPVGTDGGGGAAVVTLSVEDGAETSAVGVDLSKAATW